VATSASYARRDASAPLRAQILRSVLSFAGTVLAMVFARGVELLWVLSVSISVANLTSAFYLRRNVMRSLSWRAPNRARALYGEFLASLIAVAPCVLVKTWGGGYATNRYQEIALALTMFVVCISAYLGIQWVRGSRELATLVQGIGMQRTRAQPKKAG
jgi:peptidoglycan biosynthesis protein MviN/MurJ (putative lipid II flippase)